MKKNTALCDQGGVEAVSKNHLQNLYRSSPFFATETFAIAKVTARFHLPAHLAAVVVELASLAGHGRAA